MMMVTSRLFWLSAAACSFLQVAALDFKRHDGIHRIEKHPEITQRAVLAVRKEEAEVCGTGLSLCAASLDGGCCPSGYDCAKESCYATTQGPSTCQSRVGWHVCEAKFGGGCCPDGYQCQTGNNCVPPSGTPYTLGCPASQYLCPSSMSYGCCPNGMGCAINQCYSTDPVTKVTSFVITTTEDGKKTTITSKSTTVQEPDIPTAIPEDNNDSQFVLKYFPTTVSKVAATASPEAGGDDKGSASSGLSKGQLAGIITGAVAFLVLVIVVAFVIIRHLNKVVAAVTNSKASGSTQPQMRQYKKSDFEVDSLMMAPTLKPGSTTDMASSTGQTPTSFAGAYQSVSTANSQFANNDAASYFDLQPHYQNNREQRYQHVQQQVQPQHVQSQHVQQQHAQQQHQAQESGRTSQQSGAFSGPDRPSNDSYGGYTHVRNWSDASEDSNAGNIGVAVPYNPTLITELDSRSVMPELPGSPSTLADDQRRSSAGSNISSIVSRSLSAHHQRMRSVTGNGKTIDTGAAGLGVVNEESSNANSPNRSQRQSGRRPSWDQGDDYPPK